VTPTAFLRIEQPATIGGVGRFTPVDDLAMERGAYVVVLGDGPTTILLRSAR